MPRSHQKDRQIQSLIQHVKYFLRFRHSGLLLVWNGNACPGKSTTLVLQYCEDVHSSRKHLQNKVVYNSCVIEAIIPIIIYHSCNKYCRHLQLTVLYATFIHCHLDLQMLDNCMLFKL